MELEEFIKRSLVDITKGVRGANKELGEVVDQNNKSHKPYYLRWDRSDNSGRVHFDVAVTVKEGGGSEGGGGIQVWGIGIGGKASKTSANETVSRISFTVTPRDVE